MDLKSWNETIFDDHNQWGVCRFFLIGLLYRPGGFFGLGGRRGRGVIDLFINFFWIIVCNPEAQP
jgi:hypothetical protein